MITGFLPHEAKIKLILMVYNFLSGEEEKLVMVPYDSEADQWPGLRKGHKAHWGVVFGMALMMPYKNKAFDQGIIVRYPQNLVSIRYLLQRILTLYVTYYVKSCHNIKMFLKSF